MPQRFAHMIGVLLGTLLISYFTGIPRPIGEQVTIPTWVKQPRPSALRSMSPAVRRGWSPGE